MKTGIEIIAEERTRQQEVEGWTPENDDASISGELANAASCYAMTIDKRAIWVTETTPLYRCIWPFTEKWWKPTPFNRIKELAKAGALIAAEIDRLQRAAGVTQ